MSDSVWPHRWQPTRLPHPWDSPGKNSGVGCHFLLQCMKVKSESEVTQSCPTLSDPMDCSLPGSSIHGTFQARVLEWGAIAFSAFIACYILNQKMPLTWSIKLLMELVVTTKSLEFSWKTLSPIYFSARMSVISHQFIRALYVRKTSAIVTCAANPFLSLGLIILLNMFSTHTSQALCLHAFPSFPF